MDEKEKNSPSAAAPDQEEEKQPPSPPHTKEDPIGDILRQAALQEDKEALRGDYGPAVQFIIHGNYVSNSGTIYGGINQQQAASQNQALAVAEDTRTRVERFFSEESTYALAALITLASLQIVPESIFHEAVQDLCVRLARAKSGEDQGLPDRFLTAEQLLQPFLLQRQTAVLSYGSIQVDLRCLAFQQEDLSTEIRQQIWQNYSQIRPLLIEWLFALRSWTSDAARRTVSYTAMQCLASYAAFDLAYARGKILPFWEQHCTAQSDVKYLVVFLGQFMQWESCRAMADDLLCRWCRRRGLLWQVAYRLYGQTGDWQFQRLVPEALQREIEADLSASGATGWYRQDRGWLLFPAHQNAETAVLLAQQLGRFFSAGKNRLDCRHRAVYFLSLLRWDYLTDFSDQPELVFLRCFHWKPARESLLPLVGFLWKYVDLRRAAQQILTSHMAELGANGASCAYLEKPFAYLAFTGYESDYKNTMRLLDACASTEEAQPAARHLQAYLAADLKRRTVAF